MTDLKEIGVTVIIWIRDFWKSIIMTLNFGVLDFFWYRFTICNSFVNVSSFPFCWAMNYNYYIVNGIVHFLMSDLITLKNTTASSFFLEIIKRQQLETYVTSHYQKINITP